MGNTSGLFVMYSLPPVTPFVDYGNSRLYYQNTVCLQLFYGKICNYSANIYSNRYNL